MLHTEYATLASYQRFEVPPAWLIGAASVDGEISEGYLVGWAGAADGITDAFEVLTRTSPAMELHAPYLASGTWTSVMILHNPSDDPAGANLELRWYDLSGTLLDTLPENLPPRATMTFDADWVAPPGVDKSVEVTVLTGQGIIGSCLRTTNEYTSMAEPLASAGPAWRVPSPGTPLLEDGLMILHNPDDLPVTVDLQMYAVDGTGLGGGPQTLSPHSTVMVPTVATLPGVDPLPSVEIRATGGGRVAVVAMFRQGDSGGVCSVPALPMPEIARCVPPAVQAGWNLMSIPLDPADANVASVLAPLEQAGNVLTAAVLRSACARLTATATTTSTWWTSSRSGPDSAAPFRDPSVGGRAE